MKRPQDALEAARHAAAGQPREPAPPGDFGDTTPSARQLVEWSIIEPDEAKVYSTRRYGRPITLFKRLLVRLLRQYLAEVSAQQSRFNALAAAQLLRLEERVDALEAGREDDTRRS